MSEAESLSVATEAEQDSRRYVFTDWSVQSKVKPLVISRAKGVWLYDVHGKAYLDFASQLVNVNAGHQHPKIVQAIKEQAETLGYVTPYLGNLPRTELARTLAQITPGDLTKSLFTSGGAEANENAIRIARLYTGRPKVITRYRSFHGATHGAITLSGDSRRWTSEPAIPGVVHALDAFCYRCSFGQKPQTCNLECLAHVEEVIWNEGPDQVAAVMVEVVTGANGIIVPPPGYMPGLRALCDKYGIMLIADEVMTGFGRTGEWFACNHYNVVPDIMTFAKGVNSGYVPLGGVIVRQPIADYFEDHTFWGGLTYAGHPLACAAAVATIQVYKEEGMVENSKRMGRVLLREMEALGDRHPSVGDVRGIGLFAGIELVKDKETREMLVRWNGPTQGVGGEVREEMLKNGVYSFGRWNVLFIAPPLCITESELEQGIAVIDDALKIADAAAAGS
ncbi:MAG: aminotransferase class III-fold pyridoxal phosphate-dependent enzyme [Bacteroidetes bacterium]|nr:aminotransferase class III-fold pyridoxal phosphate-dependent enzyme [Bacteroidota bacterium]